MNLPAKIAPEGFEALFRSRNDPWDYHTSAYEAFKRRILLHACGTTIHARGLELGCAIGVNTKALARRCLRLVALDASATAIKQARRHCRHTEGVHFVQATLPEGLPDGTFDLVVVSEVAYYLSARDMHRLIERLGPRLAPGARLVALHHTVPFGDASQHPGRAHEALLEPFLGRGRLVFERRTARWRASAVVVA